MVAPASSVLSTSAKGERPQIPGMVLQMDELTNQVARLLVGEVEVVDEQHEWVVGASKIGEQPCRQRQR